MLVEQRIGTALAASIAPRNRQVGLMLPYSPLHHLLLADVGRPLVMTSGNRSDEPIAFTNDDAVSRLGEIADLMLLHDRGIHTRCDDSVATVVAGAPLIIRRSRGWVPRAVSLKHPVLRPVLATGALLKNTFCLAAGTQAFLGPHIGDLENLETFDSYTSGIERFQRFVDIRPEIVACDLHPDYMSTMYANARCEAVVRVQHHHAHVVAAMAEHHIDGPAIGIAYDGTGFGTDGTSWGGELLLATSSRFERLATFRPIALVGGDRAVREPWRVALALALDAFDGELPPAFERLMQSVTSPERDMMASLIRAGVQVSLARGVGRYFDAFGALFLDRRVAAFEGQVALEWNQVADPDGLSRLSLRYRRTAFADRSGLPAESARRRLGVVCRSRGWTDCRSLSQHARSGDRCDGQPRGQPCRAFAGRRERWLLSECASRRVGACGAGWIRCSPARAGASG